MIINICTTVALIIWSVTAYAVGGVGNSGQYDGITELIILYAVLYPILCLESLTVIIMVCLRKFNNRNIVSKSNKIVGSTFAAGILINFIYIISTQSFDEGVVFSFLVLIGCGCIAMVAPNIQLSYFKKST